MDRIARTSLRVGTRRASLLAVAAEWPEGYRESRSRRGARAGSAAEDRAAGRSDAEELAGAVVELALGDGGGAADVERDPFAADGAGRGRDAADETDLHVGRRIADAGREQRVDRAAHRGVEDRQREAAVHDADRVVVLLAGIALDDDAAFGDLGD